MAFVQPGYTALWGQGGSYGVAAFGSSAGVYGSATNNGTGVVGSAYYGVQGFGTWIGVDGEVSSSSSIGVLGFQTSNSNGGYGVFGQDNDHTNGYALGAAGAIAATIKMFRIDHPFDPAHKYLLHYCAEGPEPLNVYSGTAITDRDGYAWIRLPDYFDAINRDCRYQLTVVDGSDDFVLAKVSKEESNDGFQIRTSKPLVKVCWEVDGVRNDRYVKAYGTPVEVVKPTNEQGTYIHPELYGQPEGLGLGYAIARRGARRYIHRP